jgi:hypothetical protein
MVTADSRDPDELDPREVDTSCAAAERGAAGLRDEEEAVDRKLLADIDERGTELA